MSMRCRYLLAGLLVFVVSGFTPNLAREESIQLSVPPGDCYRLPPGRYSVHSYQWYTFVLSITRDASGKTVDWSFEERGGFSDRDHCR